MSDKIQKLAKEIKLLLYTLDTRIIQELKEELEHNEEEFPGCDIYGLLECIDGYQYDIQDLKQRLDDLLEN